MPSPLPDEELLSALRSAAPTPPKNLLERWQPPVPASTHPRRSWVVGLAAATVCGIAFAFLPDSPVRPTPTFANMENAMLQAKTVAWSERTSLYCTFYVDGRLEKKPAGGPIRKWADLRIPAVGWGGARFKQVSRDGHTFQITSEKGSATYYQVYPWSLLSGLSKTLKQPDTNKLREEIVRSVILPKIEDRDGAWKSSNETIGGQEYLKLTKTLPEQKYVGSWKIESTQFTFWIAPDTRRIFKQETKTHFRSPKNAVTVTSSREDFRYDETQPANLFQVQPAVGSRYVYVPQPNRKMKPEEDKAIRAIVNKAEQAWNAGDAATYLSLWRFDHPTNGSSRAVQLAAIRNPNRHRWFYKYGPHAVSTRISGVYTHRAGDAFPPKNPVEFGLGPWGVLKEPDGFKIVKVFIPSVRSAK